MIDTVSQWVSADIHVAEEHAEIAMDFALALGGLAIVEKDDTFQVSYALNDDIQLVLNELKLFLKDLDPDSSISEDVVDRENWNKNWQAYFKPTQISDELIILPEWELPTDYSHRVKTRIRPAMAFGTGTHETTQLCLEMLETCIRGNERVLDLGTGSGILGITALHLGAAWIDAIENDPVTEENIQDNLKLNGINSAFRLQITESPELNPPYDLMLVNIIKARLFPLLPSYFDCVRTGGKVLVSGLLATEDEEIRELLADSPWKILKPYTKNEWIAYLCEVK
ncbi:50S ribosomal protein L11 methyltransferase [bacterium]|nr:50S ribosomal protein L11 methyltransferase [bacterium]